MGGRGASGATYRGRINLASRLAKVNSEINAIENEARAVAHNSAVSHIKTFSRWEKGTELISSAFEGGKYSAEEFLYTNERYTALKEKQSALTKELKAMNAGQRRMF